MDNISMQRVTTSYSIMFFLLLHHAATVLLTEPPYTPTEMILWDCGSINADNYYDANDRLWMGDDRLYSSIVSLIQEANKTSTVKSYSGFNVPYGSARISQFQFTYAFSVSPGPKFIRLYFRFDVSNYGNKGLKDCFDVKAGPYSLLKNFSASRYGNNGEGDDLPKQLLIKEFCLTVEENQKLSIIFIPSPSHLNDSFAFINGIEIVSMPTNLYYTPPGGKRLTFIGSNTKNQYFYVQNDTALEKICRLNVGGNDIHSEYDTGMYREWKSDDNTVYSWKGLVNNTDSPLNYSKIPAYTAPDDVYRSTRQLAINQINLTWIVQVDPGFRYLVRLHFCEMFYRNRRMDIFIDQHMAEVGLNVFKSSGFRTPMYKDYIVATDNKEDARDKHLLLITVNQNAESAHPEAFLNGMEVFKLSDDNGSLARNIYNPAVPPTPPPSPDISKSNSKSNLFLIVGVPQLCLIMIVSFLSFFLVWRVRKRKSYDFFCESLSSYCFSNSSKGKSSATKAASMRDELCRHFSLDEIKVATNNFHESLVIGVGGFGNVYKGHIKDADIIVAVKRLNPESEQGTREFKTEVELLSQLRHINLVSLIGYCYDDDEMILVYDYMANGTLRQHLYENNNNPLSWKQRLEICIGAARGLHYLHAGVKQTIIHRDVKTTNILLDENWTAKVSDFGLSKRGANSNIAVSTIVKGTWGYLDPEYAQCQQLTEKADVYSFGVVLFEVLCARKPVNQSLEEYQQWNLAIWARICIQNGTIHQIVDPFLAGKIAPESFHQFVGTAESCVRNRGIERPSMHDVMKKLEYALELQETADAENKEINLDGEYIYPQVSFRAPPQYMNIGGGGASSSNASGLASLDTDSEITFASESDKTRSLQMPWH